MANQKPKILGAIGTFLAGLWQAYAYWTTASQLPADAGWVAKLMADPPVYLPWLLIAGFALLLGWSLWPKKKRVDKSTHEHGARIKVRQLGEGSFEGISDTSGRPFLDAEKADKLAMKDASFGGAANGEDGD